MSFSRRGRRVAADAKLLEANALFVNEAAPHRESLRSRRMTRPASLDTPPSVMILVFMGTAIANGTARRSSSPRG